MLGDSFWDAAKVPGILLFLRATALFSVSFDTAWQSFLVFGIL